MGKLGKKARKFAKKHLQSVLKQRRKTKAVFKRKAPKTGQNDVEETEDNLVGALNGRSSEPESTVITSLDAAFTENETDEIALASDSDGYLSEVLDWTRAAPNVVESETGETLEDAPFSPLDHEAADSFLQLEKSGLNAPFIQYYGSVLDKASERKLHKFDQNSLPELKASKKNAAKPKRKAVATNVHVDGNGTVNSKRRKKALEAQ